MPFRWVFLAVLLWTVGCGGERRAGRAELVVSAAVSLREVLTELSAEFEARHPGAVVAHNFGGSGGLKQQIRQGAGVDLFIAASERDMDDLAAEGRVAEGTRRVLAGNELVLVTPASDGRVEAFDDLGSAEVRRVALGDPRSVPAGDYARQALERLGVWSAVAPKAVLAANVRQVLAYVERGEVDAGLVYRTDALGSGSVRVVAVPPPGSHAPIRYPAAVVSGSRNAELAGRYLAFLTGPVARETLRRHGFRPGGGP